MPAGISDSGIVQHPTSCPRVRRPALTDAELRRVAAGERDDAARVQQRTITNRNNVGTLLRAEKRIECNSFIVPCERPELIRRGVPTQPLTPTLTIHPSNVQ
jgi:hypothetical protein